MISQCYQMKSIFHYKKVQKKSRSVWLALGWDEWYEADG
jgi:hypothetical protein